MPQADSCQLPQGTSKISQGSSGTPLWFCSQMFCGIALPVACLSWYCRGPIPFIGIKRVQYTWLELLWLIKGGRSNWWFSMLEKKKGFETAVHALTHHRCLRLFLLHEPWVNDKEPCAGALFWKYEPGWSGCKLSAVIRGYKFILSKIYFLLILGVFITGQSALLNHKLGKSQTLGEDIAMFSCRVFNYIFSMCKLIISALACTFPRSLHLVFCDKADAPGFSQMLEWGNKIGHLASGLCQFFFEKDWKVTSCVQLPLQPLVVCLVSCWTTRPIQQTLQRLGQRGDQKCPAWHCWQCESRQYNA
jgi:hypothetical protein